MAVVMVRNGELIDSALGRFARQVIREGIIMEILEHRFHISRSEKRRIRRHELKRSRRRRRRRSKRNPLVKLLVSSLR